MQQDHIFVLMITSRTRHGHQRDIQAEPTPTRMSHLNLSNETEQNLAGGLPPPRTPPFRRTAVGPMHSKKNSEDFFLGIFFWLGQPSDLLVNILRLGVRSDERAEVDVRRGVSPAADIRVVGHGVVLWVDRGRPVRAQV